MPIKTPSLIDAAISKYGGSDEAYKLKLKTGIRDALGYSNYMSRLGQETANPADIGDIKGLSPQGIQTRIASRFGQQDTRVNALSQMARGIDTAAGSIADSLAAKSRASMRNQYDTSFVFHPTNPVEDELLRNVQNPYNEDGSIKSLQQIEAELNDKFGQTEGYSPEDIKKMIVDKLPPDYIGKERFYQYRFHGMSEEQATDETIIDYGSMIVNGQADKVPPELYAAAYATLTPAEKAQVQGFRKSKSAGLLEGL